MDLPVAIMKLPITEAALQTAQTYAYLVHERLAPVECIGFLAGDAGSNLVDTVILAPDQQVSAAHAAISGQGVLAAGRELQRLGKQPLGWWHSHGMLPNFHSAQDHANTGDILAQVSRWTYIEEEWLPRPGLSPDEVRLVNPQNNEIVTLVVKDKALADNLLQAAPVVRRQTPVALAYSLVINARGEPAHAELHARYWCSVAQEAHVIGRVVPLEILPTLDEARLLADIRQRVQLATRPRLPRHPHLSPESAALPLSPSPTNGHNSSPVSAVWQELSGLLTTFTGWMGFVSSNRW